MSSSSIHIETNVVFKSCRFWSFPEVSNESRRGRGFVQTRMSVRSCYHKVKFIKSPSHKAFEGLRDHGFVSDRLFLGLKET